MSETGQAKRRGVVRLLLLVIAVGTVIAVFAYQRGVAHAAVGHPAPSFDLTSTTGHPVSLAQFRGHVVLLDFWASWCTVCEEEAPALRTFAQRYGGEVTVVGVDWKEPSAIMISTVQRWGLPYLNLRDASGLVADRYGLSGVPEAWWIGPNGTARLHVVGAMTFTQMQSDYRTVTGVSIDQNGVPPLGAGQTATALADAGGTLWLGATGGLWRDGATGWQSVAGWTGGIRSLAAGPGWVAGLTTASDVRLWQAANGTWANLSGWGGTVLALADEGNELYALAGNALWRCDPSACRPRSMGTPVPLRGTVIALGVLGSDVVVTTSDGVLVSGNGGTTWQHSRITTASVPSGEFVSPLSVVGGSVPLVAQGVALTPRGLYLAGPDGVYFSADLGRTGQEMTDSPARPLVALTASPSGDLWAVASDGDLYRYTQGTWAWRAGGEGTTVG